MAKAHALLAPDSTVESPLLGMDEQDLRITYRALAETCRRFTGWRAGFLVGNPLLEEMFFHSIGRPRIKKPLANANLRAYFYLYDL